MTTIQHHIHSQKEANIPFRTYIAKFLEGLQAKNTSNETISGYKKDLEMINRFLEERYNGIVMLHDIKTQDLEDYLNGLSRERKYQPASVNRHLCTMRSFYNFAIKRDWTNVHAAAPIDPLKAPTKERTYIDEKEYHELVQAIDHPTIKTIVQFLFYTGLRIAECLNLTLDDVDIDNLNIHVKHGKGDKERNVPISAKLSPILTEYKDIIRPEISSKRFFALEKTGKVSDVYVNYILHKTTAKLGWKKVITCHILRHSFASNLVKKDVHVVHIQKLLGHSDLKTTSRYVHSNYDQLAKAVAVL
ncbi:tyrosine-type recombinase/integrase [Paenibacillus physcomitrellae]|uniref:Tyrosine recombinase XerC n=1 Tax=Paenibacillus physcomitrellae TaxID=1619311 RepID=A0ABQ1GHC6_9BACL|nr:tyrosine-type recombinase/integrase [Paenibacillus physcomitrellae]GGA43872.1 tyrosine recombinase XerC [Paenibacillus physcomitrellae]